MLSRRSTARLAIAAAALTWVGCRPSPPPPSVLVVTIAGWSATRTTAAATPALDGLALTGTRVVATIAATDLLASEAAVQTGLGASNHGLRGARDGEVLAPAARTLAEAAAAVGAVTAGFVASPGLLPRLDRGLGQTGGSGIARRRPPATVVDEAVGFLTALGPEQRFYLWVQLDARDDLGGIDGLPQVDAEIARLLAAVAGRTASERTLIAAVGTVGEPSELALLGEAAIQVFRIVSGPATPNLDCGGGNNAIAGEVARRAGLDQIACAPVEVPDAITTARRFGLLASPAAPDLDRPLPRVPADLLAELSRLDLPAPLPTERLARAGDSSVAAHRQPVLDQALASIRLHAGHVGSAQALYERAIAADPLALEALVETARMAATTGDVAAPEARLAAVLPSYRGRPDIYHALAHVAFLRGAHDRALACARVAGLYNSDDLDITFDIAVNQAALGQTAEALASLERALSLGLTDLRLLKLNAFRSLHAEPGFARIVDRLRPGA